MNLKSLFVIVTILCLAIAAIGAARLAADAWMHSNSAETRSRNYRGLGGMLTGLCLSGVFWRLYRGRKF